VAPKTNSYNSTKSLSVLSEILNIITVNQVNRMACVFRKNSQNTILLAFNLHHWKYEVYNTAAEQLRYYAQTFWEFQSLESDESVYEYPDIFLTYYWINVLNNPHLTLSITAGFAILRSNFVYNLFKDDGDQFLFGN